MAGWGRGFHRQQAGRDLRTNIRHEEMKDLCSAGVLLQRRSHQRKIKKYTFIVKALISIYIFYYYKASDPHPEESRVKVHRKLGGCHFSLLLLLLAFNVRC